MDPLIKSQLLYQLSYTPIKAAICFKHGGATERKASPIANEVCPVQLWAFNPRIKPLLAARQPAFA